MPVQKHSTPAAQRPALNQSQAPVSTPASPKTSDRDADPDSSPRNPWPKTPAKRRKPVSTKAFKRQMIASQPALKKFAFRLCGREDFAEDLTQETLMKAWAARHQFKPGSKFLSWAFTILRNTWINRVRRDKKFVAEFDDQAAAQTLSAPAEQTATMELADLQRAMSELPTDQLEAVMLVGPGDYTYEEAGYILGCAAGTVKSRASRARSTLGDIFEGGSLKMTIEDTQDATTIAEEFVAAVAEIEDGGNIEDIINLDQSTAT